MKYYKEPFPLTQHDDLTATQRAGSPSGPVFETPLPPYTSHLDKSRESGAKTGG